MSKFEEKDHPRDGDGKFTDAVRKYSSDPKRDLEYSNLPSAKNIVDKIPQSAWENAEKDDSGDNYEFGSQEELDALLGEEFKDVKGQAAIDKLLHEQRGHVKGAFHRDDLGDIDIFWGNDGVGLQHIIQQRLKEKKTSEEQKAHVRDVLRNIESTINNGVFRKQNKRGDMEFVYNGYGVAIAPTYHNRQITYVLTAYKNEKSEKK